MSTQSRKKIINDILDKYSVICPSKAVDEMLAAIQAEDDANKMRKKKPAANPGKDLFFLARAIADVCQWPFDANKGQLMKEAKLLSSITNPEPTPEAVKKIYGPGGAWYTGNYHGLRGDLPTPAMIRKTWLILNNKQNSTPTGKIYI